MVDTANAGIAGRSRGLLWAALGLAAILRTGILLRVLSHVSNCAWLPDSSSYHRPALALLRYGVFSSSTGPPFVPEVFRTPGYPVLLALSYSLFGIRPAPVLILQAVLSSAVVALAWFLGRELFGERTAGLAAIFVALDMTSLSFVPTVMSETVFAFLFLLAIVLLVFAFRRSGTWWAYICSGLVLALANFVRPVVYYLVPLLAADIVLFALAGRRRQALRPAITAAVLFILAPLLLLGAWQYRNWRLTGQARFSQIENRNLLFYRAASTLAVRDKRLYDEVALELGLDIPTGDYSRYFALHSEVIGLNEAALAERWRQDAFAIIAHNPHWYALLHLRGTFVLLFDPGAFHLAHRLGVETEEAGREIIAMLQSEPFEVPAALWRNHRLCAAFAFVGICYLLLLYAGVVIWLIRSRRIGREPGLGVVLVSMFYLLLVSTGAESSCRFRIPLIPLIAVLAAAGWASLPAPGSRSNSREHRAAGGK